MVPLGAETESRTLMIRWHLRLTPCAQRDRKIRRFGQHAKEEGIQRHWQNLQLRARISPNTTTIHVEDALDLTGQRQADTLMWDAV